MNDKADNGKELKCNAETSKKLLGKRHKYFDTEPSDLSKAERDLGFSKSEISELENIYEMFETKKPKQSPL